MDPVDSNLSWIHVRWGAWILLESTLHVRLIFNSNQWTSGWPTYHRTLRHLGKVSYLATFWCQLSRKAVGIQIVEMEHVRYSRFSHDVTAAMLEPLNKETAAMLEPWPNPPGIQLYYYANVFFCFRWKTWLLITWVRINNCNEGDVEG